MKKQRRTFFIQVSFIWAFTFALSIGAFANTYSESFSNVSEKLSSTAVWNASLQKLHPPLLIAGWDTGSGPQNTNFSVGTGRHGDFVPSRYSTFGQLSGTTLTLDTDQMPVLEVTYFHLASGYTLNITGSKPLIIRSQSSVDIDAAVNCSGRDGDNAVANNAVSLSGATGRCGGAHGGASVPAGQAPTAANNGASGGTNTTGGAGGLQSAFMNGGEGGGGGGAYVKTHVFVADKPDPTAGSDSNGGAGGAAGTIFQDDAFQTAIDGSGSGGGGGSGYNNMANLLGFSSGASGGAGGGSVQIYAVNNVNISATGSIHADGGNGGTATNPLVGGGGGGGGGGSILIFAGGHINTTGAVTAKPGAGGSSFGTGDGGNGAWGRTWIVESLGYASAGVSEDPVSNLINPGQGQYETGVTYTATSVPIDLSTTKPKILATPAMTMANSGNSTTSSFSLAFSDSDDSASLPAYAASSSFVDQLASRYVSFQVQFDNTSATAPASVTLLTFDYDPFKQSNFKFQTGCGNPQSDMISNKAGLPSAALILLPLIIWIAIRSRNRN